MLRSSHCKPLDPLIPALSSRPDARLHARASTIARESANVEAEVAQLRKERVGLIAAWDVSAEQASGTTEALARCAELDEKISVLSALLFEAHKENCGETEQQLGLHRQVNSLDQTLTKKMEVMQVLAPRCARLEEENLQLEQKLLEGNEAVEAINEQRAEKSAKLSALREQLRLVSTKYSEHLANRTKGLPPPKREEGKNPHDVAAAAAATGERAADPASQSSPARSAGAAAFAAAALADGGSNALRSTASVARAASFVGFGGEGAGAALNPLPPPPSIDENDCVMTWLQAHLEATPTIPGWLAIKTDLIDRFGGAELDAHKAQVREILSYQVLKKGRMMEWLSAHLAVAATVPTWLVVKDELVTRFGQAEFDLHKEEARTRLIAKAKESEAAAAERAPSHASPAFTVDIGGGGRASTPTQLLQASSLTPFDVVDSCMRCGAHFGFFKHKAHCWSCGSVTCKACSPQKFYPGHLDAKIRVCVACDKPNNG